MTQQAPPTALTPEVQAMVGVSGDVVESWGVVDAEYMRRFTQALMDPDPRYWDDEFARSTRYGEIITPPIMVSYLASRIRPDQGDPITAAFEENPESDGIGSVERPGRIAAGAHQPGAGPQRRQRDRAVRLPQHRRHDLLPEPLLGYSRAPGSGRHAVPHHHPRDPLLEPA